MPQNVITKQIAFKPQPDAIAKESASVESYADRLMDDLFEDVDRVLDENSTLPTEPVQPEVVSLKPIAVPHIVLPATMLPSQGQKTDEEAIARQVALAAKKLESNRTFDRILLGAAFASLVITLGLWLASRGGLGRTEPSRLGASETQASTDARVEADAKFADYMQQSIDTLDQKKAALAKQATPSAVIATAALPTIPVSGAPAPNAGIAQAINRVADALEQQGTQPAPTLPQTQVVIVPPAVRAGVSAASPVAKAPTTPVSPTTQTPSSTPTSPTATTPASPATALPAPASPAELAPSSAAPAPSAAAQPAPATPSVGAASSEVSGSAHTLVGILELGDRSAALFEIDGVARRIYVGESIGASGWTLAEVKNQEAVIRRGGEVRSVFVGQKF
ncbi:MAG: hypothetical protein ACM37W_22690 [Actinomycetota bacterium]